MVFQAQMSPIFAVSVVVPTLTRDRICDRLAQFMRTGGRKRFQLVQTTGAASASRIGHHCIEDPAGDVIVISTEHLAGGSASLNHSCSCVHIDEIKSVRTGVRVRHRLRSGSEACVGSLRRSRYDANEESLSRRCPRSFRARSPDQAHYIQLVDRSVSS